MSTKVSKVQFQAMKTSLLHHASVIRDQLPLGVDRVANSWAELETFLAISLRIMAKTNHSKIQDEFRTVEISARLAGRPVLSDD